MIRAWPAGAVELPIGVLLVMSLLPAVVGFFLGGINPASIFARLLGKDLSQYSGNPGATNAGRVLGRKWGVLVGVLDVLKGWLPTLVVLNVFGWIPAYLTGVALVLGHVYSPYLRGRGGKGVATALGTLLAVHPLYALVTLLVFVAVFAVTRWVALASLAGAGAMLVAGGFAYAGALPGAQGGSTAAYLWALAAIVFWRHRHNIVARIRGERTGRPGRSGR